MLLGGSQQLIGSAYSGKSDLKPAPRGIAWRVSRTCLHEEAVHCHLHTRRLPQTACISGKSGNRVFLVAEAAGSAAGDTTAYSSNEQALIEQLQALLDVHSANLAAKAPPTVMAQQLGLQFVTTSQQAATAVSNTVTDTMGEEAEEGDGDGMAVQLTSSQSNTTQHSHKSTSSRPDMSSGNNSGVGSNEANSELRNLPGWGQSALRQLQARSEFAALQGSSKSDKSVKTKDSSRRPWARVSLPFDPMDTVDDLDHDEDDDDEYSFGIEAAVHLDRPNTRPSLWNRPPGLAASKKSSNSVGTAVGFLGNMSVKLASKVGGLGKAAAKKVAESVAEPLTKTSDKAAAAVGTAAKGVASKIPAPAVAAAQAAASKARTAVNAAAMNAVNATASVKDAAAGAVAAAKSGSARLLELGGMHKSSWVVADAAPGTLALAAQHPVRIIGVTAGAELTRAISKLHQQHQSITGLVSFESQKLGVKVPQVVYNEASTMYTQLLPLVMDFITENPDGRVCFTGSGAGGSLATVLGLMAASRGLRPHCMTPCVIAFDAPPVLAEVVSGALWGCGGQQQEACDVADWEEMVADVTARGLLSELGLPKNAVLNISSQGHTTQSHHQQVTNGGNNSTSPLYTAASVAVLKLAGIINTSGSTSQAEADNSKQSTPASNDTWQPGASQEEEVSDELNNGSGKRSTKQQQAADSQSHLQLFKLIGQVRTQP